MGLYRDGRNASAYLGVRAPTPPQFEKHPRAPTANDYRNFNVSTIWLDTSKLNQIPSIPPTSDDIYILVAKSNNVASWINFGNGDLKTLTGDSGGAVSPDISGNINLLGTASSVIVTGTPASNLLTLSLDPSIISSLITDSGTATGAASAVSILGGTNINTVGAASTVTINLDDAISLATSVTSPLYTVASGDLVLNMADDAGTDSVSFTNDSDAEVASIDSLGAATFTELDVDNVNVNGNTIISTDVDGDITLTPNGTGKVNITYATPNTVAVYGTAGALSEVSAVGTNGQVLTANTGGAPTWQAAGGSGGGWVGRGWCVVASGGGTTYFSVLPSDQNAGYANDLEAKISTIVPSSGTFSNLFVRVTLHSASITSDTDYILRVNGVDTLLLVAVGTGVTGTYSNLVDTVAVVQGDEVSIRCAFTEAGFITQSLSMTFS